MPKTDALLTQATNAVPSAKDAQDTIRQEIQARAQVILRAVADAAIATLKCEETAAFKTDNIAVVTEREYAAICVMIRLAKRQVEAGLWGEFGATVLDDIAHKAWFDAWCEEGTHAEKALKIAIGSIDVGNLLAASYSVSYSVTSTYNAGLSFTLSGVAART